MSLVVSYTQVCFGVGMVLFRVLSGRRNPVRLFLTDNVRTGV